MRVDEGKFMIRSFGLAHCTYIKVKYLHQQYNSQEERQHLFHVPRTQAGMTLHFTPQKECCTSSDMRLIGDQKCRR